VMDMLIRRAAIILVWAFTIFVQIGGFSLMEGGHPIGLPIYLIGLGLIIVATSFGDTFWKN
jgi:hypothetical protein